MAIDRQAIFSGTRDVAASLAFDPDRLTVYLERHIGGFSAPLSVRQFKGGQSNPTYLLETPARRYALRRKPPGKLLPSAHAIDREYRVMAALAAQGFPVPRPLSLCMDETVIGTAFYVMEHVDGRVMWEPSLPHVAPVERASIYEATLATLARLHSYDPAAAGLADYGRGENYVARQVDRWSRQYRASETQRIDEMERLMAWLPERLPPPTPSRIVHGDYRIDNVMFAYDAPRVIAVIDWELSTLGDPLADFTYHLMQWDMPPSDATSFGSLVGVDLEAFNIPSRCSYVDRYAALTGLDPRPYLPVYLAYNFFRIAAILQGIAGRVRDGTAASEFAAAQAERVRPLAITAWDFARQAGG